MRMIICLLLLGFGSVTALLGDIAQSRVLNASPEDFSMTVFRATETPSPFVVSVEQAREVVIEETTDEDLRRQRQAVLERIRETIREDFANNQLVGLALAPEATDRGSFLRGGRVYRIGEDMTVETVYRERKRTVTVRVVAIKNTTYRIAYLLPGEVSEEFMELPLPSRLHRK